MALYDLTVTLLPGMPTWDGEPGPSLQPLQEIGKEGGTARVSALTMGLHCGTHVDAPCHYFPGGAGVEALPLDAMIGPCRVIVVGAASQIEPADLAAARGAERVLLKTSSTHLWDDPTFRRDFVALGPAAARWLVDAGVRLVGIDYLSVDPYAADPPAAHLALLGAGVVVVEGLDLRAVPPGEYDLTCLPLKLAGADGAPARVVLRTDRRTDS
ncbi:MAG: cyclase family protein [Chloroflexi bacterium]|nr:cyclase family protein [Chloroflexota bacterium]